MPAFSTLDSTPSLSGKASVLTREAFPEQIPYAPMKYHKKKTSRGLFGKFKKLRKESKRPLPTQYGDGCYPVEVERTGVIKSLRSWRLKDLATIRDMIKAKMNHGIVDDKTMLMERVIQLVAKMPSGSKLREELTNDFINKLWNTLDHPPLLDMSEKTRYRQPDGSHNNPRYPELGAAGQPYCRSVRPGKMPLGAQPDPGLIFDSIMARDEFKRHPNNISSLLWYWATIITHDVFWSDPRDGNKNKASSYLDLAPLYGSNKEMCDSIRTFKDGKLKPDSFADKRLLAFPPGVPILLIMFNRFHNHIATNLAIINENNRFPKPAAHLTDKVREKAWKKYDEDLFQTARLITGGLYISIILIDYVRNIINLNRVETDWTLDPRQEMGPQVDTRPGAARGTGNTVSAEFNLCYRWHGCLSQKDEKWIEQFYSEIFSQSAELSSPGEMLCAVGRFEASIPADPFERTFGGFQRGSDGKFNDDELVKVLTECIDEPAGSFGAKNVPKALRAVEMMGILRGRKWQLAGINEFRKNFGLKPYETFEDINSDPDVASALRTLYLHPDNVELYTGIMAEENKDPMVPGVGIAPTYTISRVVLSDAACLVRGDRFYTTDYHPQALTNWGYKEIHYDLKVNHGCSFSKLFLRAFPNHFRYNSVYAHFPMVITTETRAILETQHRADQFDYSTPCYHKPCITISTCGGVNQVLSNKQSFAVPCGLEMKHLVGNGGSRSMLSGDLSFHEEQRNHITWLYKENWNEDVKRFYKEMTKTLIERKTFKIAGLTGMDVVRDLGNTVHTHFVTRMFALPLKTDKNPNGIFSEMELYKTLSIISSCIQFDLDIVKSFGLRQYAKLAYEKLADILEVNVKLSRFGISSRYVEKIIKDTPLSSYGKNVIRALFKEGLTTDDIVHSIILPNICFTVPTQAQLFAQIVDFYLSDEGKEHLHALYNLANSPESELTDGLLFGYAMEGIRLGGTSAVYRIAAKDVVIHEDDERTIHISEGSRIFASFAEEGRYSRNLEDPDIVNPRRSMSSYMHFFLGLNDCFGDKTGQTALIEMCRGIFSKKGLRRVPGGQGILKRMGAPGGTAVYMDEWWGALTPFPQSMLVMWDEE